MKQNNSHHNVQGNWRGYYAYAGGAGNVGFEAVFLENKGSVDGNILDDGRLGEATAFGAFSFPSLTFTKVYISRRLPPVKYQGQMSDEGKVLSGTWRMSDSETHGTWMARRYEESEELKFEKSDLAEAEKEKPLVESLPTKKS